jgi:hypothetical protein
VTDNPDLASPPIRDTTRLYHPRHGGVTELLRNTNASAVYRVWPGIDQELSGSQRSNHLDVDAARSKNTSTDLSTHPGLSVQIEAG